MLARYVVGQSPDGIVFADREGTIRLWNRGAERIFGYSVDEALGESLDLIVPERFRDAHWTGYRRAMAEGRTKYAGQAMPTRSARKDGARIYVELTFAVLQDDSGNVLGALANVRDITERYGEGRELRRRLTELQEEVRRLLQGGTGPQDAPPW